MKKFFVLFLAIFFITTGSVYAKSVKNTMPYVKMNGKKFSLYYSAKSSEINGYINEYYKKNEGYTIWTELIGVHHYPSSFYPIEHAQEFRGYLEESGVLNEIEINDKDNSAILDFVVISDKKLPIVMEFNVFKYVKSSVCGTIGFQYAKRYLISNALEVNRAKKEFAKTRRKYIKRVKKINVPELVNEDIDKGQYLNKPEIIIPDVEIVDKNNAPQTEPNNSDIKNENINEDNDNSNLENTPEDDNSKEEEASENNCDAQITDIENPPTD